ncbi:MAG: hypothetical protein WCZ27_01610 [Tissierellaceae bacterium]
MKKKVLIGALIMVLGVGSIIGYAETSQTPNILPRFGSSTTINLEEREAWLKERSDYRNEQIKKALESGIITEEEARTWAEHFTYMEDFQTQNNYGFGFRGCGGYGMGRGMGMMKGYGFRGGFYR